MPTRQEGVEKESHTNASARDWLPNITNYLVPPEWLKKLSLSETKSKKLQFKIWNEWMELSLPIKFIFFTVSCRLLFSLCVKRVDKWDVPLNKSTSPHFPSLKCFRGPLYNSLQTAASNLHGILSRLIFMGIIAIPVVEAEKSC